ncbi:MAG: glycosyltransferase family 4 protein [Pyrinomonadaceae bacterium]|nr:glycosyltransferase family 4 protein [Pyrinomonadaceae bacterium]
MRILHISSAKNFGGGEKHFVDLCHGLQNRGHEVFVVIRPTSVWKERLNFLPPENILEVSIRNSIGIFSAQRIARFINQHKIEIVHAHLARDYFPTSLACRLAKSPKFVLTRHVLFPMKAFYRFALKNLSKAIAVSSAVKPQLEKLFPAEKITIISNGINIENFSDSPRENLRREFRFEHNIPFDSLMIAAVGELIPLKGQEDLIIASQLVAEKFPDTHFVIVGKDNSVDQSFRRKLKRLVNVFGLEDKFLWLNWVEDMATLLHACDLFVSPSHSESFGLAILEAMASSCPVAATETEGAKELIGKENLVPIENPTKLAGKICEFLANEKLREEFGKNLQTIAKEKFCLDKMIEETEEIYRNIS